MASTANRIPQARHLSKAQQVFLGSELAAGGGLVIDRLCLREDETFGGSAGTYNYTILLGPTNKVSATLTTNFAGNFSGPTTTVFSGSYNLPANAGAGGVNSFNVCIDFTTPYVHNAGDNLLVEWINSSTSSLSIFHDYCLNDVGCTTGRVFALDPTAVTGSLGANQGLIMRFRGTAPPPVPSTSPVGLAILVMLTLTGLALLYRRQQVG